MSLERVQPSHLVLKPFHLLDQEWAILVGGRERGNPMTVSWGGFGTLWNRPVVTVYVRPTRYTHRLLEAYPEFTLNVLPPAMRESLDLAGSLSGRDGEKWKACGLTPEPGELVAVPKVAGAELQLECRTLTTFDLDPSRFVDLSIEGNYPQRDYHRAYVGEVAGAWASERFLR